MAERKTTKKDARAPLAKEIKKPSSAGKKNENEEQKFVRLCKKSFEATHEHILKCTFELFAEKGYASSSTREIARNAGITEVTLYRHFRSKEELFVEVIRKNSLIPIIENLPPAVEALPLEVKLKFLVTRFMELFQQKAKVFKVIVAELISHPQHARMFFEKLPMRGLNLVSMIFEAEVKKGTVKKLDPKLMARSLLGSFLAYNIMQEIFYGKDLEQFDPKDVVESFLEIFLNGVKIKEKVNEK